MNAHVWRLARHPWPPWWDVWSAGWSAPAPSHDAVGSLGSAGCLPGTRWTPAVAGPRPSSPTALRCITKHFHRSPDITYAFLWGRILFDVIKTTLHLFMTLHVKLLENEHRYFDSRHYLSVVTDWTDCTTITVTVTWDLGLLVNRNMLPYKWQYIYRFLTVLVHRSLF